MAPRLLYLLTAALSSKAAVTDKAPPAASFAYVSRAAGGCLLVGNWQQGRLSWSY